MRAIHPHRAGLWLRSVSSFTRMGATAIVLACAACQSTDHSPDLLVTVDPAVAYVAAGDAKSITATVHIAEPGPSTAVVWTIDGNGCAGLACGTIEFPDAQDSNHINFRAPAVIPDPPLVTLTATSDADPARHAKARITLGAMPITLSIAPSTAVTIPPGESASFVVTVTGDSLNRGVAWTYADDNPWDYVVPCNAGCGTFAPPSTTSGQAVTFTSDPTSVYYGLPQFVVMKGQSVTDPSTYVYVKVTIDAP